MQISEGKKSGSIREKHLKWKHWILWIWGAKRGQMVRISLGRGSNKIDRNTNCEIISNPMLLPATNSAAKYRKLASSFFCCWQMYNLSRHKFKRIAKKIQNFNQANQFETLKQILFPFLPGWGMLCQAELIDIGLSKTTSVDQVARLDRWSSEKQGLEKMKMGKIS